MKKILFIVSSILFFATTTNAQTITNSKLVDTFQLAQQPYSNVLSLQLKNTNIAVIEHSQLITSNHYLNYTIKVFTEDGTKINTKSYSLNGIGYIADIKQMSNGDIALLNVTINNYALLFLDSVGNLLRSKVYPRNPVGHQPEINRIYPTLDNNLLVVSHKVTTVDNLVISMSFTVNLAEIENTIFKFNDQGILLWQKKINSYYVDYNNIETDNFNNKIFTEIDILPNSNNEFNFIRQNFSTVDSLSTEIMRFDKDGNYLWNKTLGTFRLFYNGDITSTNTARTYIANNSYYYSYSVTDLFFGYTSNVIQSRYDKSGNLISSITNPYNNGLISLWTHINNFYAFQYGQSRYSDNNNDIFFTAGYDNFVFFGYYYNATFLNNSWLENPFSNLSVLGTVNLHLINDSTFLLINYQTPKNANNSIGFLSFNRITLDTRVINYKVYVDTDNDNQLSTNDERPNDIFLESIQDNNRNLNTIYYGENITIFNKNKVVSKFSNITQGNHLYTATPETDTNYYNPNKTLDTVYFRLTKVPNIQDLEVYITPTTPARPGFAASYIVHAKNIGTKTIHNLNVKFLKDTHQNIIDSTLFTIVNDTVIWSIDSLAINQSINYTINCLNDTALTIADTLHLFAAITPFENDTFVLDNSFILNQNVVNSFDPNDKLEAHGAGISPQQFSDGDYLYYTIRFQNTGNSYATKIKIVDTLSAHLDWSTLELLSSSHTFSFNVQNNNVITWSNDNLYLPDSTTDEAGSHGYVSFRIKPNADFSTNDIIQNRAHIYFDFNAPVITNTTSTVILQERITTIKQNSLEKIKLFPSPTNGNVQLQFDITDNKNISLYIIDINGKMLLQKNIQPTIGFNTIDIDLSDYSNGIYFIQLASDNKKLYYGKVMKQ